ncbi:hypothetical protein M231_07998 [Tremella mesenterica]|uniref:Uncharacterized protein n=1 Tax=Tremella mesenterica TaxID=5217 RepID=A0A4Q1BAR4_TREME|nr:hypothetical protein M231_07998 [Tremella mesenterica]
MTRNHRSQSLSLSSPTQGTCVTSQAALKEATRRGDYYLGRYKAVKEELLLVKSKLKAYQIENLTISSRQSSSSTYSVVSTASATIDGHDKPRPRPIPIDPSRQFWTGMGEAVKESAMFKRIRKELGEGEDI